MHFNISITSRLFWVHISLTTFSWGLYRTSIIESNLKSNLSVVFILMFCWVSTTAAVTTVLPMKRSKHKSTHYLQFPWNPADVPPLFVKCNHYFLWKKYATNKQVQASSYYWLVQQSLVSLCLTENQKKLKWWMEELKVGQHLTFLTNSHSKFAEPL